MMKWTHLSTSRTQKLSTSMAKIVGPAPAKIAHCQVVDSGTVRFRFFLCISMAFLKESMYHGYMSDTKVYGIGLKKIIYIFL